MASAICGSGRGASMSITSAPSKAPTCPMGPIWLYVGRVAIEKNIEAFLELALPGTKLVVGDGPARGRVGGRNTPMPDSWGPGKARPWSRPMPPARLCLSQPHRYFRPGAAGGPRQRHSGGGLSGGRAPGRGGATGRRRRPGGGPGRRPGRRLPQGPGAWPTALPRGHSPWSAPGGRVPSNSCAISWSSRTRPEGRQAFPPVKPLAAKDLLSGPGLG